MKLRTLEGPIQEDLKNLDKLLSHSIIVFLVLTLLFAFTTSWKWHTHDEQQERLGKVTVEVAE